MSGLAREAAEKLGAAISRVVASGDPPDIVLKWVALVEVIDGETAERGIWALTPEGATAWDTLGLLEWAKSLELASIVRDNGRRED